MTDLPPGIYEICSACGGECDGCVVCWDQGLVEHECAPEKEETDA